MNPVLLKPGSDRGSHDFVGGREALATAAYAAYDDLSARFDVVVCEGAGSPAEVNLRRHDFINMGLARHASIPALLVGDIDRGGVFAAMHGTLALLEEADQSLLSGLVINKFRRPLGRGADRGRPAPRRRPRTPLGRRGGAARHPRDPGRPRLAARARARHGLLDVHTTFGADKVLALPTGHALGAPVSGYEIRHGRVEVGESEEFPVGARSGAVLGTMWHGCLEGDAFRAACLELVERGPTAGLPPVRGGLV